MIHQRIAGRMSYVLEQSITMPEPTDAELRAWFNAHRDRWAVADHIDFIHVYIAGSDAAADARANELLASLTAGAPPERLGDTFPGGRRYRGRKLTDLALQFGDEFVTGLATQPIGTWVKRRSRHGLHLVRVERVDAGTTADFEAARLDVRKHWLEERRAQELSTALRRLRDGWTLERQ